MDYFNSFIKDNYPLAQRMKPESLERIYGQDHVLGEGKVLRKLIESDNLRSIILFGPPGTGKTSIANVISKITDSYFIDLNATYSNVKELREVIDTAKDRLIFEGKRTLVFIDEIHRFNKLQQDVLLPFVEKGTIILIGATTENPFFEVNSALLSRSMIFELFALGSEDIRHIVTDAVNYDTQLLDLKGRISEDALDLIADISSNDARRALNLMEALYISTGVDESIDASVIKDLIDKRAILYDKKGDNHYDNISAFIKSIRGSDPDAAIHYLAKMIKSGEDPKFIARRLIISASEDIGLANTHALRVAVDAFNAVNFVGMPEGRIILSHATIYLCLSPKSNSAYIAIDDALADLEKGTYQVPEHLMDSTSKKTKGRQASYKYPHDYPGGYIDQQYLPMELSGRMYYSAKEIGDEKRYKEMWQRIKGR